MLDRLVTDALSALYEEDLGPSSPKDLTADQCRQKERVPYSYCLNFKCSKRTQFETMYLPNGGCYFLIIG